MAKKTLDFVSLAATPEGVLGHMMEVARRLKKEYVETGRNSPILGSKVLGMVFEKPSLRTRLSFEVAMVHLGGHAVYLSPAEIGLGKRESVEDVARAYVELKRELAGVHRNDREAYTEAKGEFIREVTARAVAEARGASGGLR